MCKKCRRVVLLGLVILAVSMLGLAQRPSPPAQAQCTFSDGNIIATDYSSPRMKGRKIFGGVVPYGQVFRTGANEASTFLTTTDLIIGGKNVPAGSYTIFTIPSAAQWTLIINKKIGEWGAPYKYESDELARIEMHVSQTASAFENFTVTFDPKGNSCALTISWENTQASVQIAEIMPGAHATIDLATLQQRAKSAQNPTQSAAPNSGDAEHLYSTAMDFLAKAYLGSDKKAHAVPGTAAAFVAVIQADPAGPYGAKAREALTTFGLVWPDWDGQIPEVPKPATTRRPMYSPPPASDASVMQAPAATVKEEYEVALKLLHRTQYNNSGKARAVQGAAPALLLVIQHDPNGPYGEKARLLLMNETISWPDWDGRYFFQVASVHNQENAESLLEALKSKQYPAFLATAGPDNLFRVVVGPFADVKEAESARIKLVSEGYNPLETTMRPSLPTPPAMRPSAVQAVAAEPPQPASPDPDEAEVQAQVAQRQQRIDELQSDIDEQEQEAATWEQSENNMDDSSTCSGPGAALCQSIGNLGAAKARENANKARNQADEDRRQLAELEGQPAPEFHKRDTSYAGALANEQQEHPTPSILDTGNQQAAAIRGVGDTNAAQQQAAAQQRAAAQRSAQQAATNRSSNPQNGASQAAGGQLPTGHTFAPLTVRFGTISGYQGNAHVVSTPPGIDCPSTCSFQFGENAAVMLFATADQNSAVKYLTCQMSSGTGMLQAGNSMSCSIPQWAYEGGPVTVDVDQYPGPGRNSSGSNGHGSNGTRSGGNGNSSGRAGSGSSGGNSGSYLAPIAQGCVREFWDPKFYNWLSFENDCGQAISLTWIAKNPSDHFGGASNDNIAPGQSTNTGWSQTEVTAKGNFTLYICPAGSVAVDPHTGQSISSPNATYSCKKQ